MLKTEDYVIRHIPIVELIKKARQYDDSVLKQHLKRIEMSSWYRKYFEAEDD
jgi:hypothetical protein